MTTPPFSPGWYPDPSGTAGRRYWDGDAWSPFKPSPWNAPPGWYPDPSGAARRRYWDGSTWGPVEPGAPVTDTAQLFALSAGVRPAPTGPTSSPPPPSPGALSPIAAWWASSSRLTKAIAGGVAACIAVGLIAVISASNEHNRACTPATPNPSRNDFIQENSLKDSLSDTWNSAGGIGEEVRDGDFAFTVSAIEVCDDGYARVAMTVTNTDDIPHNFEPGDQRLLRNLPPPTGPVPKGGFECQLCDGIGDSMRINPGDSIQTVVPFAIKGEPAILAVELHDSPLSFGVKVFP